MSKVSLILVVLFLFACASELVDNSKKTDSGADDDAAASSTGTANDSDGNTIQTNDTVSPSTDFCVKFTESVDLTTCTTETLTLICDGTATSGSINTSVDTDAVVDNECCFLPSQALPAGASCTFLVSGVVDKSSNEVAETTVTVTTTDGASSSTSCTSSDDYSKDTSSCYKFNNTTNQTDTVANSEAAAVTITGGQLKFDMTTYNSKFDAFNILPSASKEVSGDFDAQITVSSMTVDSMNAAVKLIVVSSLEENKDKFFQCALTSIDCYKGSSNGGFSTDSACDQPGSASGSFTPNISIRVVRSGSTFQCFRKLSSGSFVQIGSDTSLTNMPTGAFLAITAQSESTSGSAEFILDDLTFNSGKAVGQD
ncbi:MAG: hypothetical protein HYT76_00765 [Deltaproteobacteria bacterium]|nr:hypothetical protein [Deltaproteobacteria bacterium]